MKSSMFKSLRWRLQIWHTIVLLVVLSSFGAIVHRLNWQNQLQQVDAELNRAMNMMMWQIRRLLPRPPGRRPPGPNHQEEGRPDHESGTRSDQNAVASASPSRNEVEPNHSNDPPNVPPRDRPMSEQSTLSSEFEQLFHGDEDSRLYFVIWNDKNELILKSEFVPEIAFPNVKLDANQTPVRQVRERHSDHLYREVVQSGPFRGPAKTILIGRSLEKDLAAHRQSGLLLVTTGLVVLAAGMIGGGWLSARAIRPISSMTAAAESISAQNLSERINVNETDSELGNLAKVLNGTFDRLQSAFERQQQFTADASHELRTPLSVISTHTELALSRPRSTEDYQATIETCQRAARRMRTLIDALLVLARYDSGAQQLKQDSLNIESLVQECVELVRPLAVEREITIECQTAPCEAQGDWDRLSQVVTNLLTNAIRYNVDGGSIFATTRVESASTVISIADTGIGIAADQLPLIFDRFYQVDKARSRSEGSCGLGLSICKTIVEAHGGTIMATSQPELGTTIEVRLPSLKRPAHFEKSLSTVDLLVSSGIES